MLFISHVLYVTGTSQITVYSSPVRFFLGYWTQSSQVRKLVLTKFICVRVNSYSGEDEEPTICRYAALASWFQGSPGYTVIAKQRDRQKNILMLHWLQQAIWYSQSWTSEGWIMHNWFFISHRRASKEHVYRMKCRCTVYVPLQMYGGRLMAASTGTDLTTTMWHCWQVPLRKCRFSSTMLLEMLLKALLRLEADDDDWRRKSSRTSSTAAYWKTQATKLWVKPTLLREQWTNKAQRRQGR